MLCPGLMVCPVRFGSPKPSEVGSHPAARREQARAALSGIHPHPIEEEKARRLEQAFGVLGTASGNADREADTQA